MPAGRDKAGHPVNGVEPVYLNMLKYLDLPQAAAGKPAADRKGQRNEFAVGGPNNSSSCDWV